jgi:hypothetical protein
MIDAEHRLAKVMSGDCKVHPVRGASEWELHQWRQFGPPLQLSCNPASPTTGFAVAMKGCPEAFRMHFPCIRGAPDEKICTGAWFGEDVKKVRRALIMLRCQSNLAMLSEPAQSLYYPYTRSPSTPHMRARAPAYSYIRPRIYEYTPPHIYGPNMRPAATLIMLTP